MRAGHDFSGMTNRDEVFPQLAAHSGLKGFIEAWKAIFMDPAPGQLEDLLELLAAFRADLIVADETCFGAGLAREKTGLPLAVVATSIYFYSSRDTAPIGLALPPDGSPPGRLRNAFLRALTNRVLLRDLRVHGDKIRAAVDLPKLHMEVLNSIHLTAPPELYLMGTVPSFEYPRSDRLPQTYFVGALIDPPQAPYAPPAWWGELGAGRPVVHVTQGTVSTTPSELLLPTVEALAGEDVLVVATSGGAHPGRLEGLPANVRLEPFIPHSVLLPHVDVMVTNGGYQGVNAALSHGVPLVVAGATEEKPEVAAHVAWAGAGLDLKTGTPSPAKLRAAVRRVLTTPRYRQRAQALRAEYARHDAPELAAELIEKHMAAKSRHRSSDLR